ncbi:gp18 [Burkholderia phage BcepC6B]|uniref:Gp18 n=1 Tax=Burkholderia phage BcepC6B TaxID=2883949 RepID=Q6J1Q9_9CAUD|nr:tail fiber protein [Burkholderia phage BcepC6B]AAT38377.1 gp18 [Burkholderia phage BcepC6B]
MTVTSSNQDISYATDGATTSFPTGFYFLNQNDVFVDKIDSNGVLTPLVLGTDYSVSGAGVETGGAVTTSVVYAPGSMLHLYRLVPPTQETEFQQNDPFPSKTVEKALDKLTMLAQQTRAATINSIRYPLSEYGTDGTLPKKAERARKILGFDDSGQQVLIPMPASIGAGDLRNEAWTDGVDYVAGTSSSVTLSRSYGTKANLGTVVMAGIAQDPASYGIASDGVTLQFDSVIPVGVSRIWCIGGTTLSLYLPTNGAIPNVRNYGATGNGGVDDTLAIQECINSLASSGGEVFLPPGVYLYSTLTLPPGVSLRGASSFSSVLLEAHATGDCIIMQGDNTISNLQLNHKVTRTSGRTVWMQGNNCTLREFEAYNYYQLWDAQTSSGGAVVFPKVINGNIALPSVAFGSNLGFFTNYANALVDQLCVSGTGSGTQPGSGINLVNGDTCIISNTNITRHGINLNFRPGAGRNIFATHVSNSLFDSSNTLGNVLMAAQGGVFDTVFSNSWMGLASGAAGFGCNIAPPGGGNVDGVSFGNCIFPDNDVAGLSVAGTASNIFVDGGYACGSVNGYVFNAIQHFSVTNARAGNVATRGANSQFGIAVIGAADNYIIANNNLRGNGVGGLNDSGAGVSKIVSPNLV